MSGVVSRGVGTLRPPTSSKGSGQQKPPAKAKVQVTPATSALGRRRLVVLLATLLFLFGLVMITSAASGSSLLREGDQWEYFRRQMIVGVVGFIGMLLAMRMPLIGVQ